MPRIAIAILVALTATGCGAMTPAPRESAATPGAPGPVAVAVTADWGAEPVASGDAPAGAVIDATAAVVPMETAYGGRFVSALADRPGDGERDWIFWLNGIESDVGAADIEAVPGDRVWWDLHRWNGRVHVPAVVGSWPAPIERGLRGAPAASADEPLASALALPAPAAAAGPRVLVGADADLRARDADWAAAAADPGAWGLTAWIEGDRVLVWDAAAGAAVPVPGAVAVMVATTADGTAAGDPLVAVTGLSAAAATAAAERIAADPALPLGHAALCLDADGRIVCSGGRGALG